MTRPGEVKRELFGTRTCRHTAELREDLDWEGHPYTLYYVDEDGEALERLSVLVDGPCMVPVLVVDGEVEQIGHHGRGCYVRTDNTTR